MTITINDIQRRLKLLPESSYIGKNYRYNLRRISEAINSGNPEKIMKTIQFAVNEDSNSVLPSSMFELLDALIEYGSPDNVRQYGNMIAERYVAKVRDAKETQTNLKRKLGRMKAKYTTKIQNNYEDIANAINAQLHKAQNNLKSNLAKVRGNVDKGMPKIPIKKNSPSDDAKQKAKQEAAEYAYQRIIDECTKAIYCDRILENYNRISKRFNIDRIIQENIYINGIEDTINEICHLVETYDVPDKVKFNTTLESVWYGFHKNYVDCSNERMVTAITDYYLAKGNNRKACSKLLEASMIVKKSDYKGDLEVIQEEEPEDDDENLNEAVLQDSIRRYVAGDRGVSDIKLVKEASNFNSIFEKFRASDEEHKENKLQFLVRKLYSRSVDDIIDGTPSLLNYIRIVFILGTVAINPVLGAIAAIADVFISLHMSRNETEKMIKFFEKEIETTDKKMASSKNAEEKDRLKKYKDQLKKSKEKIEEYYDEMLTDKEMDAKYDADSDSVDSFKDIIGDDDEDSDDFSDDDFNFDDDDFEDFNEAVKFIPVVGRLVEEYDNLPMQDIDRSDLEQILNMCPKLTYPICKVSHDRPDIIRPELLQDFIDTRIDECKSINYEGFMKYKELYILKECKELLAHPINENKLNTIYNAAFDLAISNELYKTLNSIREACQTYTTFTEASFTNSIALASEKLKKTLTKMSDKEKQISKNIDVAANNTKKAVERSLTTDNRESVIKGSILPSASKTIKLAITGAGLAFINPALAVIGVLGFLGMNKKYKAKERQMVIDELEIELKMCEKYIDIAESKNDMKALKKLLTIQRELQRQLQRVKYKMKVDFGQKYYDANAPE